MEIYIKKLTNKSRFSYSFSLIYVSFLFLLFRNTIQFNELKVVSFIFVNSIYNMPSAIFFYIVYFTLSYLYVYIIHTRFLILFFFHL